MPPIYNTLKEKSIISKINHNNSKNHNFWHLFRYQGCAKDLPTQDTDVKFFIRDKKEGRPQSINMVLYVSTSH